MAATRSTTSGSTSPPSHRKSRFQIFDHKPPRSGSNSQSEESPPPESNKDVTWPTDHNDYALKGLLGRGAFAKVYLATCKPLQEDIALKVIELEEANSDDWNDIRKETALMQSMRHKNVVRSYTSFSVSSTLWLVMPFVGGGSCADVLKQQKPRIGIEDESVIATIIQDVLKGLMYFHAQGYIHRDIKAANILLTSEGTAKLSDFGISGQLIEGGIKRLGRRTFTGTPCFMAPEVIEEDKKHNTMTDIWSLGVTVLELGFGRPPYASERPIKVMQLILNSEPPTQKYYTKSKHNFSTKFDSFVSKCLRADPVTRKRADVLISHPFVSQAKSGQYVADKLDFQAAVKSLGGTTMGSLALSCIKSETEESGDLLVTVNEDPCLRPSKTSWIFSQRNIEIPSQTDAEQKSAIAELPTIVDGLESSTSTGPASGTTSPKKKEYTSLASLEKNREEHEQ